MTRDFVNTIRAQFPIFAKRTDAAVYLDSAATSQKPQCVLDALLQVYSSSNGNVHRSAHRFARECTDALECARGTVAAFLNAPAPQNIIFTKGATESLNLVAQSLTSSIRAGQTILVSALEHHSNLVPWQELCTRTGAILKIIPLTSDGDLDLVELEALLDSDVAVVSVAHVSNVLGTVLPIKEIGKLVRSSSSALFVVDGAQAVAHLPVDVQDLDVDFYCFSGHKVYGPNGIGVLYGRMDILDKLPPYQFGGEMIEQVSFEHTRYNTVPYKFEAGTPDYPAAIALRSALDFLTSTGWEAILKQEQKILDLATQELSAIPDLTIYGAPHIRSGLLSFNIAGIHHFDLEVMLDRYGVAVRSGHHCAEPLVHLLGTEGTVRASFGIYTNPEDIFALSTALKKSCALLKPQHSGAA